MCKLIRHRQMNESILEAFDKKKRSMVASMTGYKKEYRLRCACPPGVCTCSYPHDQMVSSSNPNTFYDPNTAQHHSFQHQITYDNQNFSQSQPQSYVPSGGLTMPAMHHTDPHYNNQQMMDSWNPLPFAPSVSSDQYLHSFGSGIPQQSMAPTMLRMPQLPNFPNHYQHPQDGTQHQPEQHEMMNSECDFESMRRRFSVADGSMQELARRLNNTGKDDQRGWNTQ